MTRRAGFTLVELLVVIAIIAILAGIAVPKVAQHLRKSKVTRALAEAKAIDLAFATLLTDTGRTKIADLFVEQEISASNTVAKGFKANWNTLYAQVGGNLTMAQAVSTITNLYTDTAYKLLRTGKEFIDTDEIILRPEVRKKLQASYLELGTDPWQNKYRFLFGPPPRWPNVAYYPIYLRSYRGADYWYNGARRQQAEDALPGNPLADNAMGFPAPKDLPVYVYSLGEDGADNQGGYPPDPAGAPTNGREIGGGDDVNNWDNNNGWDEAYGG